MKDLKCRNLIVNVLAPCLDDDLKEQVLRRKYFSVLLDESTDVSNDQNLCILVKFVGDDSIETAVLDLQRMGADGSSAEVIFNKFADSLQSFGFSIDNIVGACSDNCNTMVGDHNSFKTRLLAKNKNIMYVGCICHLANLIASAACETLPAHLESLLHSVYNFFCRNPKRQRELEEEQKFMHVAVHKILKPAKTRWLSISACVDRLLEQWEPLKQLFFRIEVEDTDKDVKQKAKNVVAELGNLYNLAYFQFLQFVLPLFNSFNAIFQSNTILICELGEETLRFHRVICSFYLKAEAYNGSKLTSVNYREPNNLLSLEEINIGTKASETLTKINQPYLTKVFLCRCLEFYQKTTQELIARLPIRHNLITELSFVNPREAVKDVQRLSINNIAKKFSEKVDYVKAIDEWNMLPAFLNEAEKLKLKFYKVVRFWRAVFDYKNSVNQRIFPNISELAFICMTIPHANADVERIFSMITDVKRKNRNRMLTKTTRSLIKVKTELKRKKKHCYDFEISSKMIKKFNSTNLYQKDPEFTDEEEGEGETEVISVNETENETTN